MKSKKKGILLISILLVVGMVMYLAFIIVEKREEQGYKIGLILSGATDEAGWNGMHYEGLKTACEKAKVQLLVRENVKEFTGECEKAVREMAKEKTDMIVLSSYGYSEEVADCVSDYPEISFYTNSSENHDKNMTSYFVRMYQARYLSGVLAGMRTESDRIGYVAAMPNHEVNRGISAFTLGVRSVNPDAEVVVAWSGAWDDAQMEAECARKLIEEYQTDVMTYHQNGTAVIDTAEKYEVDSIGYHQSYEGYSPHYLTSVMCHWDMVYAKLVKELLSGETNKKENLWIGLREDAVGLSAYSELVCEEERKAVQAAEEKLLRGQEVFSGLIYDMDGKIRCQEGEMISDQELLENFDWYVQGVTFYEK